MNTKVAALRFMGFYGCYGYTAVVVSRVSRFSAQAGGGVARTSLVSSFWPPIATLCLSFGGGRFGHERGGGNEISLFHVFVPKSLNFPGKYFANNFGWGAADTSHTATK